LFHSRAIKSLCLAAATLLLTPLAFAQLSLSASEFLPDASAPSFELPLNSAQPDTEPSRPKPRLGDVSAGWTYLWADQGAGYRANLNGWFARPSFNVWRNLSVFADFTNYYGQNAKGSVNSHGYTFGVAQSYLPKAHVKPSIFAEAGDVRSSSAGTITNQFAFATGLALGVPFNKHVELKVTPAEWVFLYPNGDPRNDFNAKVGLSFPFGRL
jgi:hypothetical protein